LIHFYKRNLLDLHDFRQLRQYLNLSGNRISERLALAVN